MTQEKLCPLCPLLGLWRTHILLLTISKGVGRLWNNHLQPAAQEASAFSSVNQDQLSLSSSYREECLSVSQTSRRSPPKLEVKVGEIPLFFVI